MLSGIYPNLSNNDYHAAEGVSRSGIMKFKESAYKYWHDYVNPNKRPKESTPAMIFGSAYHTMILEPHLFDIEYTYRPEGIDGRTKEGKSRLDFFRAMSIGKHILTYEEHETLCEMLEALTKHEAWELIKGAKVEQSYFWKDSSGLLLKARPDILHPNIIVDLKTCADASTHAYQHEMYKRGYHVQGAMIREAINVIEDRDIPNVINICQEKTYPYEVGIKIIDESALKSGRKLFKAKSKDIMRAIEYNSWPSYEAETVTLPRWATE